MTELRELDIEQVKASVAIDEIIYIDKRLVDIANEYRIWFEILVPIFFLLLGFTITIFNWTLLGFTIFTFVLAGITLYRSISKVRISNKKYKDPKKSLIYYYTNYLKLKYPKEKNGITFQLIKSKAKRGYYYLHDFNTKKKYHVGSRATFDILGYEDIMVKDVDPDEFNSLIECDKILIRH